MCREGVLVDRFENHWSIIHRTHQFINVLKDFALILGLLYYDCFKMVSLQVSQVTFIYIVLLTIKIVSKKLHNIKIGT